MPNFDAGSYFLTVLAPVKLGMVPNNFATRANSWDQRFRSAVKEELQAKDDGESDDNPGSWRQRLRMVLATLPTAAQSPATERTKRQSPFARNRRNHLARFVVLDDVVYNGRLGQKPIVHGPSDPLVPQPVDKLASPYLLFAVDIDAVTKDGDPLPSQLTEHEQNDIRDAYAMKLWDSARDEMQAVFENCQGFDDVTSADDFARYIAKCQVETTMPFHDYWIEAPALKTMPWKVMLIVLGVPVLALVLGLLGWIGGSVINLFTTPNWNLDAPFWLAVGGLAASAVAAFGLVKYIIRFGENAFPAPKHGDLPSVLKSLYLQQKFAKFVIDNQASDPQALYTEFGKFLKEHQPENKDVPSQKPGFISSSAPGAVRT